GISQLITTILIIGFTIILAAVIFTWSTGVFTGYQKTTAEKAKADLQCAQTFFNVKTACFVGKDLYINMENTGQTDISHFLVRFKGKEVQPKTLDGLSKYSSIYKNIDIGKDRYKLEEVELFPKVNVDGKEFVCEKSTKKEVKDCYTLLGLTGANDFQTQSFTSSNAVVTSVLNPNANQIGTITISDILLTNYELPQKFLVFSHIYNSILDNSYETIITSKSFEIPTKDEIITLSVYGEILGMNMETSLMKSDSDQDINNDEVAANLPTILSSDHTTAYTSKLFLDNSGITKGSNYYLKFKITGNDEPKKCTNWDTNTPTECTNWENIPIAYSNIFRLCYSDESGTCVI
ncbi:hypothetical protein J4404_01285, partial [Candidatus Woesearchaeota archaeon]|nr:hypothetical protein [Candidatus Woesearchaeota archaeon]